MRIWGWADPGETIVVTLADVPRQTTTASDGRWTVSLPPFSAGGPFTLEVRGKKTIQLKDVVIGEVWVASGQSNMTYALSGAATGPEAIEKADDSYLRFFTVPKKIAVSAQADTLPAAWELSTPETAKNFSAVAYFFARDLRRSLGVPVGVILSAWPGTAAEEWTDPESLRRDPVLEPISARWDSTAADAKTFAASPRPFSLEFDDFQLIPANSNSASTTFSNFDDGSASVSTGGAWSYSWAGSPDASFAGSAWDGQLWPKGSGAANHPIRLSRYGEGAKPLIRGNGTVEDAVLLKNQQYWEIEDLEVTNSGASAAKRRGVHLALEEFGDAHHFVIRRLTVHNISGRDDAKDNGGILYTCWGKTKLSRFVDLLIEDNEIYHADRNGISGWTETWERSKWYPSLQVVVRGNRLRDIGGDGIMIVETDGALIEHNTVAHANQRSEGYNIAIWTWSADNSIIQYNEAYGTKGQRDGEGFDSDWNSRNTLIQYNYSHDNEGGFVLICNEGGFSPADSAGNVGTIVRYNISRNDGHRGVTISGPVQTL